MYVADVSEATPRALGDTDVDMLTWREDGQLLGLRQPTTDSPLSVRLLDNGGGSGQQLVELPLAPPTTYAATWDLAHAELLVASRGSNGSGGLEYWLARFGLEAGE
jgi:hypothetical protein